MAGLPLYLMAIPLRRSLAAVMDDDVISYNSYNAYPERESGTPSLHALGDFAIVGQAHRLPIPGNRSDCPTTILAASDPANRQYRQAHCRRQSRPDRQCDDALAGSELPRRVFPCAP